MHDGRGRIRVRDKAAPHPAIPHPTQDVRAEVARQQRANATVLQNRIEMSAVAGDLPAGCNARLLTEFVMTIWHGLSASAGTGVQRSTLHDVVDVALDAWPVSRLA